MFDLTVIMTRCWCINLYDGFKYRIVKCSFLRSTHVRLIGVGRFRILGGGGRGGGGGGGGGQGGGANFSRHMTSS